MNSASRKPAIAVSLTVLLALLVVTPLLPAQVPPAETPESRPTPPAEVAAPAEPLPESVDWRPEFEKLGLPPRSQGPRPTCSVFTVVSTLEYALAKATGTPRRLSPEFANWAKNRATKQAGDGGFFHDILKGVAEVGALPETDYPYAARFDPAALPGPEGGEWAKQAEALRVLAAKRLRLRWIKPWSAKVKGLDDKQFEQVRRVLAGGLLVATGMSHSRCLVGYRDDAGKPGGGVFYTLDSGLGRFAEVSYEFVRTELFDVFCYEILPEEKAADPAR